MTERRVEPTGEKRPAPRPRQPRPRPLPTVLAALAIFAVAFEFLAFQLSAGKDPAIGTTVATSTAVTKTRPAKKLIITKVIPAAGGTSGGGNGTSQSTTGQVAAPAPVITSSS